MRANFRRAIHHACAARRTLIAFRRDRSDRRFRWGAYEVLGLVVLLAALPPRAWPQVKNQPQGSAGEEPRPVAGEEPTPPGVKRSGLRPAPGDPTSLVEAAATPQLLHYQGRLTDPSGTPRTGPVALSFSLYGEAAGGSPLWTETHAFVQLSDGVFNVLLGSLIPFPVNAWTDSERFLGITVDDGPELSPRLRVASVPFAIEANRLNGKRSQDFDPIGAADIAAAGLSAQLKGNDNTPPNQGSNQVHWNNLYAVPSGFVDGVDDIGGGVLVHGLLQGLDANDHPQYALSATLQVSDGTPPNLGSNRVHWDNLGGLPQPLASQLLPRAWIATGAVDSTRIAAGAISTTNLAARSVTPDKLAPGTIGSPEIEDGSVTGTDVQNSSLTGDDIQNGSLAGVDIQDESILTNDIANATILGVDVAAAALTGSHIQDDTVSGSKLMDGTVTGAKLQDGTMSGAKLADGAVGQRELSPGAVTGDKVLDGSLAAVDLADGPGVAFLSIPGFADTVVSLVAQVIGSVTFSAPGPGYALVSGGAQAILLHDVGTLTRVVVAVSPDPGSVPDSASAAIVLPGSYPSELYQLPLQVQNVIPVAAAGPVTFYLTARKGTQPRNPSLHNVRLQVVFLPVRY